MAIVRCETCGKPTRQVKPPPYAEAPHPPVGHPNSGVVCGTKGCDKPGLIWLKADEEAQYQSGERIFGIYTYTAKVRVQ